MLRRALRVCAACFTSLVLSGGCSESSPAGTVVTSGSSGGGVGSGSSPSGQTVASGQTSTGTTEAGGSAASGLVDGTGSTGASGFTGATSGGGAATGAAASGSTPTGAEGGPLESGPPGMNDSGSVKPAVGEGDGDFMIGPVYTTDALNTPTGAPQGHQIRYTMLASQSTIYPGITGQAPYKRDVLLYIPQQYVAAAPAPFIVVQDGVWAVWLGRNIFTMPASVPVQPGTANLPIILDNLIAAKKLPAIVVLFVGNGGGDAQGSERGLEYDTVSGLFAEFIQKEALPRAVAEAKTQLNIDLAFTQDPKGRMTLGGSSGGAASFSMAWWHPDYFSRVVTYSGTYVSQVPASSPFPHGCWVYHDADPYDVVTPSGLIMQRCTGAPAGCASPPSQAACGAVAGCAWDTTTTEPLRVWLETGQNDNGAGSGPGSYRDFRLANQRMALALKLKGYHYHFDYAAGAGHLDGRVVAQTLPAALLWAWQGYPLN